MYLFGNTENSIIFASLNNQKQIISFILNKNSFKAVLNFNPIFEEETQEA